MRGSGGYYILTGLVLLAFFLVGRFMCVGDFLGEAPCRPGLRYALSVDGLMPPLLETFPLYNDTIVVSLADMQRDTHVDTGLLWLVNLDNPLPPGFTPQNLVSHQGIRLHAAAYTAYTQMINVMKAEGGTHGLQLVSAYRPYEYQRRLFDNKTRDLVAQGHNAAVAEGLAAKSVQRPGASEHQTGLALDVSVSGQLTQDFAATKAGQWLAANAHRFGFIIRYPQYKTEVTQIIFEPWHLRYVGIPHARIIWENGITLEEYAGFIASGPYIQWCEPRESRVFNLVMYSEVWPEEPPSGLENISSVSHGGRVGYIMTFRRVAPN